MALSMLRPLLIVVSILSFSQSQALADLLCQNKTTKVLTTTSNASCPRGYKKVISTTSFVGPQGATGATGAKGDTGAQGLQGATGAQGTSGLVTFRRYYLTKDTFTPTKISSACTSGYHFASLFEISNPSILIYDTSLGATKDDSGEGPPTGLYGWIHTGANSDGSGSTVGSANCLNWTYDGTGHYGTYITLGTNWTTTQAIPMWVPGLTQCVAVRVWCVQDAQ